MNKTVAAALAEGIANGEAFAASNHPRAEAAILGMYKVMDQYRTLIGPQGQRLAAPSAARKAKDDAYAQGSIAAYRAATEF